TNAMSYDVSVVAHNTAGDGPAGTTTVTPVGPPGAPTSVSATVDNGQTRVSFTAPASDGGSAITGYTVTAHPHGVAGTAGDHTGTGSGSPITATGLTNGTLYDISVVATNSAGDGPAGTTTVTPVGP